MYLEDDNSGLFCIQQRGKFGFTNRTGRVVIRPRFDTPSRFREGLAPVEYKGKTGYINRTGKFVAKPEYGDDCGDFRNGFASVQLGEMRDTSPISSRKRVKVGHYRSPAGPRRGLLS